MWCLLAAIFIDRVVFEVALRRAKECVDHIDGVPPLDLAVVVGITIISLIGRTGTDTTRRRTGSTSLSLSCSVAVFDDAVSLAMNPIRCVAIETEEQQIELEARLS